MKNKVITAILMCILVYSGYIIGKFMVTSQDMAYKIGLLSAPFIAVFLILNPFRGFLIMLLVRPLIGSFKEYSFIEGINLLGVFSFMYIILALYVLQKDEEARMFPENLKWFYIYLVIALISVINSPDKFLSFVTTLKLMALAALFLLGYNLPKNLKDAKKIIKIIMLSAVIPVIYGMYQLYIGEGAPETYQVAKLGVVRINSFFPLGNTFAYFLGVMLLVSLLYYVYSEKKEKALILLVIAGVAVSLVFTYTRTIWITLFSALCFISIFERKMRKWIIISVFIVVVFSYNLILLRFNDLIVRPEYGFSSLEFRTEIYTKLLFYAVPNHLFLGFGLGTAREVATHFTRFDHIPHNDYIRIIVETGLLGLAAYFIFLAKMFSYFLRLIHRKVNIQANSVFLGILLFYALASMAQNIFTFISGAGYIFCLMGLAQKINELELAEEKI